VTDMATTLIGREPELAIIAAFLDQAATGGGVLLFTGEPGVGKTAILDAAGDAAVAAGTTVLRAAGEQFDTEANFSALARVLAPVLGELGQMSDVHQRAVNAALGEGDESPPGQPILSSAVRALLLTAATANPVLLVVDDLPWLDRPSAVTLGLVARRLTGTRIGFIAMSRSGEDGFFERSGLPVHEIRPLAEAAAATLFQSRWPALADQVRTRILAEAEGNPLALLELPTALSDSQRAATRALPTVLPLTDRLQAVYASRISGLPAATRRLLLLAALDGTGDLDIVRPADGVQGVDDLRPAELAGLVRVTGSLGQLAFRHPLTRASVVALAGDAARRRAHQVLAELTVDDPERQAWHFAEAATGPDERVAVLLEQAAHRILRRGDGTGAVAALLRAADLSPSTTNRRRRTAEAALIGADVTGDLRTVSRLLAEMRQADPDAKESLQTAAAAANLLLNGDGDVDTAHRILVSAIEDEISRGDSDDSALVEALHTLALICFFGGRAPLWAPFNAAISRLAPTAVSQDLALESKTFPDPVRTATPALGELEESIRSLTYEADLARIIRIGIAADYVDRLAGCREALARVVRGGSTGAAVALAIEALMLLCVEALQSGDWDEAQRYADEGVALCEAHGYRAFAWPGQWGQALLAAVRGDYAVTTALTDEIVGWAVPRRLSAVQAYASHARAAAALSRGDFEEAYQQAAAISAPGTLAPYVPHALWVLLDLVEAAVRTGRGTSAAAHVQAMRDANVAGISSRLALVTTAAAALVVPGEEAAGLFAAALAVPEAYRWPFDQARVQLLYGEWLRRNQSDDAARSQLRAALDAFRRLRARPWQARATSELRAAGVSAGMEPATLSPLDLRIAELAAAGLTNKQIGERLALSHRTVAAHLRVLYSRLGITSRAALGSALTDTIERGQ
jgi:DNA-binding CsgD family transcriptional regulator